jgi:lipopolysaccharide/colanic/teichoic acid biosynthesis glycosyltransferase
LTEILLVTQCFVSSCYLLLPIDPEVYLFRDNGLINIGVVVASIIAGLYFQDMYSRLRFYSRTLLLQQICLALGVAFLIQSLCNSFSPATTLPRWVMLLGSLLSLVSLLGLRLLYPALVLNAEGFERVLFLGSSPTIRALSKRIHNHPEFGLLVLGFLEEHPEEEKPPAAAAPLPPRLGTLSELEDVTKQTNPNRIVIGLEPAALPIPQLFNLRLRVTIEDARFTYASLFNRVSLADFLPSHLDFSLFENTEFFQRVQMIYSRLLSLVLLLVLSPVILAVTLIIRLTITGPLLLRHTCTGWRGRPFTLYRFRTEDTPFRRSHPLGRWLRRYHLDLLPQLWNVLRGDINLIGPQPVRAEFSQALEREIPFFQQRYAMKPGLTGWAQIHRLDQSPRNAAANLEYDLYYSEHKALSLDLYILLQTVKITLTKPSFTGF